MKHTISAKAICPFYKHEDSQMIYCEGIAVNTVIHLAFANKTDACRYKKTYCQGKYADCLICSMLTAKKYE